MTPQGTQERLGRFESRLLHELKLLVEKGSERMAPLAPAPARPRPRFALVLAVVVAIAAVSASSIGAWQLLADGHKETVAAKLRSGGHLDQFVSSAGAWSLYVQPQAGGSVNWELSSPDMTALGTFVGKKPIAVSTASVPGGGAVVGRVNASGATSVAIVGRDGRLVSAALHDSFFLADLSGKHLVPATVIARDATGRTVARVHLNA